MRNRTFAGFRIPQVDKRLSVHLLLFLLLTAEAGAADPPKAPRLDADGDPLPPHVVARLGTKCFRTDEENCGLSFLSDGRTLVQTANNGELRYWDAHSGRLLRKVRIADQRISTAVHAGNRGEILVRGFRLDERERGQVGWVALLDAATGEERARNETDTRENELLAVSPDGSTIATARDKVRLYDVAAGVEVLTRQFNELRPQSLAFSPDGNTLAIGGSSGDVTIWPWLTNDELHTITIGNDQLRPNSIEAIAFSNDGKQVALGANGAHGIFLIVVDTENFVRRFEVEGVIYWNLKSLAFSPDGRFLAAPIDSNNAGGGVALWEAESGKVVHRLDFPYGNANHLAFSPDGTRLAGASASDRTFCVWDVTTGKRLGLELPGHMAAPSKLRFLSDDTRVASAGDDGTIRVWDLKKAQQLHLLRHEPDAQRRVRWIRSMDVSPDGKHIVSSSLDDTVRMWETNTGREIYRLPGHGSLGGERDIRFSSDGRRFVSWGDDLRVYVWDVATGKALQEFRPQPNGIQLPAERDASPFGQRESFGVRGAFLSPDGSRLFLQLNTAYVFDTETRKQVAELKGIGGPVTGFAISPNNEYLLALSGSRRRQIPILNGQLYPTTVNESLLGLYNLADGKLVRKNAVAGNGASGATFSHDGRSVAISIRDERPQVLWLSISDLKEMAKIELPSQPQALEFSHSGKLLAVSLADTTITVFELDPLMKGQK